ncbi:Alpha/Beta hydrolase protein [Dipodascopsis tothii]|uniref:Alpha/Beta hydrolase protein n=1 Tax=Dipodascopsis tothii TaxID=44089 RepID=UPI0034D00CFD
METETFALPDDAKRVSKTTVCIGGVNVYLYGVDELTPAQAEDTVVLILVHPRTRTYAYTEGMSHELVAREGGNRRGLVCLTFDARNHGARMVSPLSNQSWSNGNETHGQDLMSLIDFTAADVKMIMDFLPMYAPFTVSKYLCSGVSLGGHVVWRLLATDDRVQSAAPVVGCPRMTALLMTRLAKFLGAEPVGDSKEANAELRKYLAAYDAGTAAITGKEIVIMNGSDDETVPDVFTKPWIEAHSAANTVTYLCQDGVGHKLTWRMMGMIAGWIHKSVE